MESDPMAETITSMDEEVGLVIAEPLCSTAGAKSEKNSPILL